MKRTTMLLVAVLTVAVATTGVALAASSPTVTTGQATGLTQTSVVLHAAVNPNGNQTSYFFEYGPTKAFGTATGGHSVGHGTRGILVALRITGLMPGTTYYYHVGALNKSGVALGATRSFTTTGHPPASVVTGTAVNIGQTTATPTGSINPQGEITSWAFQYGTTVPYIAQTLNQPVLAPVTSPLAVQVTIPGLAPGTLYHYRLIAVHPHFPPSVGSDQTFFTFPRFRRTPRMSSRTSPRDDTRKPYGFTTAGTLHGADFVPAALRCTGRVGIRYYHGSHQVAFVLVTVGPDCKFSTPVPFRRLIGGGPAALTVKIFYRGNGYLKSVSRTNHVTLG